MSIDHPYPRIFDGQIEVFETVYDELELEPYPGGFQTFVPRADGKVLAQFGDGRFWLSANFTCVAIAWAKLP